MTGDKFFVVIEGRDVSAARYVQNVLGHGGCNTFPEYSGVCGNCGTNLHSNVQKCNCPNCGSTNLALARGELFSTWSARTRGDSLSTHCTFINRAAKHDI